MAANGDKNEQELISTGSQDPDDDCQASAADEKLAIASAFHGTKAGVNTSQALLENGEMMAEQQKKAKSKDKASKFDSKSTEIDQQLANELARKMQFLQASTSSSAKDPISARSHQYKFWATQPVPELDSKVTDNTFIDAPIEIDKIRKEPYSLPETFSWVEVDVTDEQQISELYTLLTENYVEDDENMFRFDYSREFLQWALMIPGWLKEWHCGVRSNTSGKLLAFIAAVPATIRVYDKEIKMVEINFLCVHKKLRQKRVAPVLIREITRRVNLRGVFQAAFTAGIIIPKPIGTCRYWHRSLNPKKLIESNFSHLGRNMTMQRTLKLYRLPERNEAYLKAMRREFLPGAHELLTNYLRKFNLAPVFSLDEFEHLMMPRQNVIYSYVIENNGKVTDLISFYCLPSSVMNNPLHKQIKAAYAFYNVATTVSMLQLLNDALILAKNENFDVFNALDLMENKSVLEELKFGIGDGNLQYYLYNWKCPDMKPEQIGLVLQ